MRRFLARALATVRAEVAPIARPAHVADAPKPGFGGFGDFGERGENENTRCPAVPLPAFDWLTHDAVKLAGILDMGGSYRWCRDGSLDMWRGNGLYVGFGPGKIAALRAAGLLPEGLA